ncbi:hypothetical protein E5083_17245 [Streptomyces bauhiniae]|uniref:Uncharacterized protein n=1 Tax=Streptomyces bauhiniae TaxID=2340725 RepID=A0A4Z1D158_9ACTN|nr:hypothetical protein [Streptomyces bauhiniae]TGN75444.1 hypothetical protein E5083_17245 [Streptomyces bauhiniae]
MISRRRAFLTVAGTGWALYGGLGIIGNPRYGTTRGLADITRHVSLNTLGWMWVVYDTMADVAGLLAGHSRMHAPDYAALGTPAGLWSWAFAYSAATSYPPTVGSACGWGAFTIGVMLVSGMDDSLPPYLRKARSR